jgi:hypothetical protein
MTWNLNEEATPLRLREGELMSIDEAWLSVERGRVWVTMAGDPVDHYLDSGHAIRLPRGARALVGAEGHAELTLMRPPGLLQRALRRVTQWLLARRHPQRRRDPYQCA